MPVAPGKLSQYIKDLGLSFRETPKSFIFTCPLCNAKQRLYIRKRDGKFKCFKCATTNRFSGAAEYALQKLTDFPLKDIKESLYGAGLTQGTLGNPFDLVDPFDPIEEDFEIIEEKVEIEPLKPMEWPYYALPLDAAGAIKGAQYLESRGIPLDIALLYDVRYSVQDRAIIFPVIMQGVIYGWQFRTIEPTKRIIDGVVKESIKAWSSTDLPSERTLMFADNLTTNVAVLCEGPIDAIKCHLVGGNVCTMGKQVGIGQVDYLLMHNVKKVYVGLDPDAFGELESLMDKFHGEAELLRVVLPNKVKDLGDLSFADAAKCVYQAEPMFRNKMYSWYKE
jgi:hypothetical protein